MATTTSNKLSGVPPPAPHVVDTTLGPLIGVGRLRRVAPFAITSTLSVIVAVPATSWTRPGLAIAGLIVGAVTIIASLIAPWERVPRPWQLVSPVLFLIATLLLIAAAGTGFSSAFMSLTLLPLVWLAIYESRFTVVSIGTLTALALWLLIPVSPVASSSPASISVAVFVICAVGMGATLQDLVADTRHVTFALRAQAVELESAAMMLDVMPEHVSRYRVADHAITYCNAAWAAQYHTSPDVAVGQPLEAFLSKDELAGLTAQLRLLGPDNPVLEDIAARAVADHPDQRIHWIDRYLVTAHGDEILSIGRDVTARHNAEAELAASEARFRELADKSADVVWRVRLDPTPHFDYMSPSVETILGYPPSYFLDDFSRIMEILDESSTTAIGRALNGERVLGHFDFRFRHADGSTVIGETRTTPVRGGLQGVSRDVTELRRLQANVAALALRDPLTGLANRRLLEELLDAKLARTQRNGAVLGVAFLDLDGFKSVNDTYGHECGDIVLRETARRLLDVVRGVDTVARVGGDEFVIVYEQSDSNSRDLIERLDRALAVPINITPTEVAFCPASIGIADTSTVGYDSAALLAEADRAMYEAKRAKTTRWGGRDHQPPR
ncbi:MAG: sensor domain-containing diguanylate cyclase [Actinomycetota bacterium]|nr:sensor domain-containing diguanylate cyclase [Actinomycetota bacterium]